MNIRMHSVGACLGIALSVAGSAALAKDVDARAFGAKGDGVTMDTVALQKAIDACSASGGGEVRFTVGRFLTGTIFLRDGVTLRLDASATLLGSPNDRDYPMDLKLKRVDETKCHRGRGSALIIADECRNVGIVGKGTIDCNGAAFVELSKSKGYGYQNEGQGANDAGPLGDDWVNWKYRRKPGVKSPPRMVSLLGCQDVLVEDVSLVHPAAGWAYWVMDCDRVVFDRVKVLADPEFPNNDGIHINASRDVTVSNCRLVTGDDALIVRCNCKPLRSAENKICERINVVNCQLSSFANCIRVGWLNDGVIRNCTFSNLTMTDSAAGIGFDLPPLEPGMDDYGREASVIENLVFSNIAMDRIYSAPVRFDITEDEFTKVARVKGITFSDMRCRTTRFPSFKSRKGVDIEDVVFRNCVFTKVPSETFPGKWQQKGAAYWYNDGDETFYGFKGLRFDGCTFDCVRTAEKAAPRTFCNPLPLENYPLGLFCRGMVNGTKPPKEPETWVSEDKLVHQFRELADPSLLWDDGKWYIFPSADLCWRSDDLGGSWTHLPQRLSGADGEKDRINYAPTICKHRGKYLLIGGAGHVFQADRPEGPFKDLGELKLPRWGKDWNWLTGNPPALWDPNYFSDDDGRLYFYWGCSPTNGIWGVEMDPADPLKLVSTPKKLIAFEPRTQPWEIAPGKSPEMGYLEGPWMIKHDGKYILTYASAGTENKEYAMGQAISDQPLGTFVKPKNNPFFRKTTGFITGTSHGSVAQGPDGTWWVAYTINANCVHWFERRIGLDRIDFEPDGSLKVGQATDTPQWLPGHGKGATGWQRLVVKSSQPKATDLKFKTYWQPEKLPASLFVTLGGPKTTLKAYRLIWHDGDLDTENGVKKGPFQYRLKCRAKDGSWKVLVDESQNTRDLLVDYREVPETEAQDVVLEILGGPKGIKPGVVDFSPFGN